MAAILKWKKSWYGDENKDIWDDEDDAVACIEAYPNVDSLIKLSLLFNCSIDFLVGRSSYPVEGVINRVKILSRDNIKRVSEYADLLLLKQEKEE